MKTFHGIIPTNFKLDIKMVALNNFDMNINSFQEILGCRDPRCKHKYLDSVEWLKLTKVYKLIERSPDDNDESDKHIEARDRRYSCLNRRYSCLI